MTRSSASRFAGFTLAALAVIVGPGSGCKQPDKQVGPREKITIAYSTGPGPCLVHIAFAKGYFGEEGLNAIPQPHAFGKLSLDAVNAGKADLATVADTPFVLAVMDGRKITTLAVIGASNTNEAIVAKQDRGIARPGDLQGKKIGVTPGTAGDFFNYSFLLFHGINEKQVIRIAMIPGDMSEALSTGKVDAVSTWSSIRQQLQRKFGDNVATFFGEALYTETFCVAATQEYVGRNPETVKKVLRALIKAETFVKRHPEESRRLIAEFTKTDETVVEDLWDVFTFEVALDQGLLVNFEDQTRWVIKNRLATRTDMPNYLDFIYDNALRSVKPEAVRIVR